MVFDEAALALAADAVAALTIRGAGPAHLRLADVAVRAAADLARVEVAAGGAVAQRPWAGLALAGGPIQELVPRARFAALPAAADLPTREEPAAVAAGAAMEDVVLRVDAGTGAAVGGAGSADALAGGAVEHPALGAGVPALPTAAGLPR